MLDLDYGTIGWLRRLDGPAMSGYYDAEIWAAWGAAGAPLMAGSGAVLGIIDQAELLKRVAAAIHTHVNAGRCAQAVNHTPLSQSFPINGYYAGSETVFVRGTKPEEYVVGEEVATAPQLPTHAFTLKVGRGEAVFCAACGLDQTENQYDDGCVGDVGADERRIRIEDTIARLMKWAWRVPEQRAATRMRLIQAAEDGYPASPRGFVRVPVGQYPRRYQDVVGGWNKRAVR